MSTHFEPVQREGSRRLHLWIWSGRATRRALNCSPVDAGAQLDPVPTGGALSDEAPVNGPKARQTTPSPVRYNRGLTAES